MARHRTAYFPLMDALEWDDARTFLALFRTKNLRDAGSKLRVDPSTVSRRLSTLEAALGERLFTRTRNGLVATPTASRILAHAEAMEEAAAALVRASGAVEKHVSGRVRVATTEAMARTLVAAGLLDVEAVHPDLVIEVVAGNAAVELTRGEADLAVRVTDPKQPSLKARCIAKMGIGLFASPSYLEAHPFGRGARETLRGQKILLPTGELERLPESKWLAAKKEARIAMRSNSMPALVEAALAGWGIVPLPLGWGDNEKGLERIGVVPGMPERRVWLVSEVAAAERPAVRVVANHLAALLARLFDPKPAR